MTRFLGIDLGHESIKLAEVEASGKSVDLMGLYEIPRVESKSDTDLLKEFFEKSGLKAERVAVAASDVPVFIKRLDLPFSDRRRVQSAVLSELEDSLPFEITDQVIDTQYLGKTKSSQHRYLVGLSPLAPITRLNKIFEGTGVIPTGYFLPGECLGQWALHQNLSLESSEDSFRVVIDIGYLSTQMAIVKGYRGDLHQSKPTDPELSGVFEFREFPHGLKSVLEWISNTRKIEIDEAKNWLLHRAQIKTGEAEGSETPISDELSDDIKVAFRPIIVEIYQFLQNFRSQNEVQVNRAYLTGPISTLAGLKEFMAEEIRTPVFHWAIFSGLQTDKITLSAEQERSFALALALATRYAVRKSTGFLNFRRSDQARRRILTGFFEQWAKPQQKQWALVLGGVFLAFTLYGFIGSFLVERDLKEMKEQLKLDFRLMDREAGKKAEKIISQVSKLEALFEKEKKIYLSKKSSPSESGSGKSATAADFPRTEMLLELSQAKIVEGFKLNALSLSPGKVDENGESQLSFDMKWVRNPNKSTPEVSVSNLELLKNEMKTFLESKGYQVSKLEVISDPQTGEGLWVVGERKIMRAGTDL